MNEKIQVDVFFLGIVLDTGPLSKRDRREKRWHANEFISFSLGNFIEELPE